MNNKIINWFIFILLSFIWGSSFILMKEGLQSLTAYQVASLRILSSGVVLLPVTLKYFKSIPSKKVSIIFLSGVLGSLLPAYLFCIAETGIDSALAGTLNSLTPIFVIITGALFFGSKTPLIKVLGISIAFSGSVFLFFSQPDFSSNSNFFYVLLVVLATMMYGINVNMVHRHLHEIPSLHIASIALTLNALPAGIVLYLTGYFSLNLTDSGVLASSFYASVLGVFGTAFASIIFYVLIKRAGAIFSSMVTYGIPFVAIFWGFLYGESIGWKQVAGLLIILCGVYISNKNYSKVKRSEYNF